MQGELQFAREIYPNYVKNSITQAKIASLLDDDAMSRDCRALR